nr:MAG TPA: hypothetical protein [Caudoviricetes sp.]
MLHNPDKAVTCWIKKRCGIVPALSGDRLLALP